MNRKKSQTAKAIGNTSTYTRKHFGNKVKNKIRHREDGLVLRQIEILKELSIICPKVRSDCFKNKFWFDFELHAEKILVSISSVGSRPSKTVVEKLGNLGWRIVLIEYTDTDGTSISKLIEDIKSLPEPKTKHIIRMEKVAEPSAIKEAIKKLTLTNKLGF